MKFTDGLFEFPVRIYDGFSVRKAIKDEETTDIPQNADWVLGYAEIPINEYEGCHDYFDRGRSVQEVATEGFDGTIIMTKHMGDFISVWDRKKFRDRINAFAEEYLKKVELQAQEELQAKIHEAHRKPFIIENKKRKWKLF